MNVLDWIFCLSTWSLIFCSASLKIVCLYVTYETEASKTVEGIFCNSILELVKMVFSSCVDFILKIICFSNLNSSKILEEICGHLILPTSNSDKVKSAQLILKPQLVGSFYPKVTRRLLWGGGKGTEKMQEFTFTLLAN